MCRRSLETNYTDFVCKTLQLIQDFVNIIILCRIKNNFIQTSWSGDCWGRIMPLEDMWLVAGWYCVWPLECISWIGPLENIMDWPANVREYCGLWWRDGERFTAWYSIKTIRTHLHKPKTRHSLISGRQTIIVLHAFYYKNFLHANYISHYFFFWYCFSVELHALTVSTFDEG